MTCTIHTDRDATSLSVSRITSTASLSVVPSTLNSMTTSSLHTTEEKELKRHDNRLRILYFSSKTLKRCPTGVKLIFCILVTRGASTPQSRLTQQQPTCDSDDTDNEQGGKRTYSYVD